MKDIKDISIIECSFIECYETYERLNEFIQLFPLIEYFEITRSDNELKDVMEIFKTEGIQKIKK